MPLILQHARFEAKIEGTFGVGGIEISVHRTGLDRYESDAWIEGPTEQGNGHYDGTLNRNFDKWQDALMQAAKAAVFKVNNMPAKIVSPWKQIHSTHHEIDAKGDTVKVKSNGYEHPKLIEDEQLNINLPTSEGHVLSNKLKVKDAAKEGLHRFKAEGDNQGNKIVGKVFDQA